MDEPGLGIQYAQIDLTLASPPYLTWFHMDKIAKRIENCRRHLNFSQSELARKVGVTPQAVQKWEKAKTVPRGYTLEKLAGVLGVSPAFIQFGIADPSNGHFSVEEEKTDYVVTGCSKKEDWPFSISREQFSQFSEEQRSLINRYIEILWQSVERKEN